MSPKLDIYLKECKTRFYRFLTFLSLEHTIAFFLRVVVFSRKCSVGATEHTGGVGERSLEMH